MIKPFFQTTLSNALTLIGVPMKGVKSATSLIMVGAGSRYETASINGLSHFLEHMAFKGTSRRPSAKDISIEVDSVGGEFNAFTSKDHTAFFVKTASCHLPLTLDILSDMLTHSLFKEEEIEREKGVIIEEINMYEDTPMRKVAEIWENLIFGDCPLGWDIAGKADVIRQIKREDFLAYTGKLYSPSNMVLVLAGDDKVIADEKKITSLAESFFGEMKNFTTARFLPYQESQTAPRLKIQPKKTEQAHLVLGYPALAESDDRRPALAVLTAILGGGMSSRLFIEVRERKGLCYYVHTSFDTYYETGDFAVSAGVDLKRIDLAIKTILNELDKIKKEKISSAEIKKAKEYLKGHLILDLEDSQTQAGLYASKFLMQKKIETPKEMMAKIDQVEENELMALAKLLFDPKKLNLAVIGPFEAQDSRFKWLMEG